MTVTETIDQKHQEDLQRLRGFRLLDDDFLTKCMEDMRNQTLKEGMINVARRMLADGTLSFEKIEEYAGLSLDEVKKLKADKTA